MSTPNKALMEVRAGFLLQGTTLTLWCRQNKINPFWVFQTITGRRRGPAARLMAERVRRAAKLGASPNLGPEV